MDSCFTKRDMKSAADRVSAKSLRKLLIVENLEQGTVIECKFYSANSLSCLCLIHNKYSIIG